MRMTRIIRKILVLTRHGDWHFFIIVRILVKRVNFNPEGKRALVTLEKGVNFQWTLFLTEVFDELGPLKILRQYIGIGCVNNALVCVVQPHPCEFNQVLPRIWEVIWARDHDAGSIQTFNWGGNVDGPRWMRHWNESRRHLWFWFQGCPWKILHQKNWRKDISTSSMLMQASNVKLYRGRNIPLNRRYKNIRIHFKETILSPTMGPSCK